MKSHQDSPHDAAVPGSEAAVAPALTKRQKMVLTLITTWIADSGYPPTIREIGRELGIKSTNGVNDHLKALERKGYLVRDQLKSRALRPTTLATALIQADLNLEHAAAGIEAVGVDEPAVVPLDTPDGIDELQAFSEILEFPTPDPKSDVPTTGSFVEVPLIGRTAAGQPILAEQHIEDTVRVDSFFLGNHTQVFALRVVGESMIGDGIHDGDFIFVKKQAKAERGQIVVVTIDDEATCKRYYPERDHIRFQPSNPDMAPIYVHRNDFRETLIAGVVVGVYRMY